jgi:hypothetical protein
MKKLNYITGRHKDTYFTTSVWLHTQQQQESIGHSLHKRVLRTVFFGKNIQLWTKYTYFDKYLL